LNSEQALADLAIFIQTKNTELGLTNPKWVVFGGSYPGALALWFKKLYPTLAVGAVGSSAPVEPRLDFFG
jgi:pimeloyl-ACP methyl ester carboxylesterase